MFEWKEQLCKTSQQLRAQKKKFFHQFDQQQQQELKQEQEQQGKQQPQDQQQNQQLEDIDDQVVSIGDPSHIDPEYRRTLVPNEHIYLYFPEFNFELLQQNKSLMKSYKSSQSTTNIAQNNLLNVNSPLIDSEKSQIITKLQQLIYIISTPFPTQSTTNNNSNNNLPPLPLPNTMFELFYHSFVRNNSARLLFNPVFKQIYEQHPTFIQKANKIKQQSENNGGMDHSQLQNNNDNNIEINNDNDLEIIYSLVELVLKYIPEHELPHDYYVPFQSDDVQNFLWYVQTNCLSFMYHYLNIVDPFQLTTQVLFPLQNSIQTMPVSSIFNTDKNINNNSTTTQTSQHSQQPDQLTTSIPITHQPVQALYKLISSSTKYSSIFEYILKVSELLISMIYQPHIGLEPTFISTNSTSSSKTAKTPTISSNVPPDCGSQHMELKTFQKTFNHITSPPITISTQLNGTVASTQPPVVEFEAACFKNYAKGFNIYFE
jgi:hypothetical protein